MTDEHKAYLDATYDMFLGSIIGEKTEYDRFLEWVREVEEDDAFPFETCRTGAQTPQVSMRRTSGEQLDVVNMSSYNYLGFGYHPEVIDAAKRALDVYGLGAASSPVHSGGFDVHRDLERALLDFYGLPDRGVSVFSSGYGVNTGVISALMRRRHHIVLDRAAHMSILEGAQLAGSNLHYFEHNDVGQLRDILTEITANKRKRILVCTEGVFSADGDFGALRDIVDTAKEFGAMTLVDEAHSAVVAGETGRGVAEMQGVLEDIDLYVLTFSKALGGVGGALIAPEPIARYVNWYAKCRMFSCALDPAVAAGVTKAIELGGAGLGQQRRERVLDNATLLRDLLRDHVDLGVSESWIVTVNYGDEERTIPLLDLLQRRGLDASVLQFPAVPIGESRIRLFVTSEHTHEQLKNAANIVIGAARELGFARSAA